ncbi:MAG: glycosyltransferase, partial [Gammaproteobacteria bacterium]|nr:glycosyltransferase [Gammaproteobacteria bacterium]
SLPDSEIEMVLVTGQKTDVSHFDGYVHLIRTSLLDRGSVPRLVRKAFQKLLKRDILLYLFLRKNNISFLSHSGYLWRGSEIPSMPWIPDFQPFHMPYLYDAERLRRLKETFSSYVRYSNCVLLSSYSAKRDLEEFIDKSASSRVVQFASTLMQDIEWRGMSDIQSLYKLDRPWFHLPNQFWAHKNHDVVIEALKLAKDKGYKPLVVATGNTQDHRNPAFIVNLENKIKSYGLEDSFIMPGIVPYADMFSLMRHAIAVINPSKFEGWSTSVEEARSLGKQTLLSDIDVHREQNPPRCQFFDPRNPSDLSDLLIRLQSEYDPEREEEAYINAMSILPERRTEFALRYQSIVLELLSNNYKNS